MLPILVSQVSSSSCLTFFYETEQGTKFTTLMSTVLVVRFSKYRDCYFRPLTARNCSSWSYILSLVLRIESAVWQSSAPPLGYTTHHPSFTFTFPFMSLKWSWCVTSVLMSMVSILCLLCSECVFLSPYWYHTALLGGTYVLVFSIGAVALVLSALIPGKTRN